MVKNLERYVGKNGMTLMIGDHFYTGKFVVEKRVVDQVFGDPKEVNDYYFHSTDGIKMRISSRKLRRVPGEFKFTLSPPYSIH